MDVYRDVHGHSAIRWYAPPPLLVSSSPPPLHSSSPPHTLLTLFSLLTLSPLLTPLLSSRSNPSSVSCFTPLPYPRSPHGSPGVVVDQFNAIKARKDGSATMTESQAQWVETMKAMSATKVNIRPRAGDGALDQFLFQVLFSSSTPQLRSSPHPLLSSCPILFRCCASPHIIYTSPLRCSSPLLSPFSSRCSPMRTSRRSSTAL